MNNQAAQTMPSVDAFMAKWGWLILSRCRDEFRADLTALSQTAGVPDGMVMVQKHDLEWIVAHVLDECDGSGPCADLAARRVRALLAAAPAASGGDRPEPDARCNCGWGDVKYHLREECSPKDEATHPPAGASMSERARELLAAEYLDDPTLAEKIRAGTSRNGDVPRAIRALEQALTQPLEVSGDQVVLVGYKNESGEDCSAFLTASRIGQLLALTQQRGECEAPNGWTPDDLVICREAVECLIERSKAYIEEWGNSKSRKGLCGAERGTIMLGERLLDLIDNTRFTTPQPGAEALRELVQRWRHEARDMVEIHGSDQTFVCVADALEKMADELESLLARGGK